MCINIFVKLVLTHFSPAVFPVKKLKKLELELELLIIYNRYVSVYYYLNILFNFVLLGKFVYKYICKIGINSFSPAVFHQKSFFFFTRN